MAEGKTASRTGSLPARIFQTAGGAIFVLLGLATLGLFVPAIPVLGEAGPLLVALRGPWFVVLGLLAAGWSFHRWRKFRRRRALLVTAMALFTALGMGFAQARQVAVAQASGATISLGDALLSHSQADPALRPETFFYARHDGQGLPLDVHRPKRRPDGRPAPVFIYVHGGGWGAETLRQRQADLRWFVERGFLVMSFEYPLASERHATWNVTHPLLGCALVWANANAARFGGDPARIAIWGESAGGNLVLNLSNMAAAGTLRPSCPGALPVVKATVALYPVVDPERMYHNPAPLIGVFGRMMTTRYTGGTPAQFPDRYREIASATHITSKAPPMLLVIPEADHLVVPDAAFRFAGTARKAGVTTDLIRMPYAEHAFDLASGSIGNQMVRQVMLAFLARHGVQP